MTFSFLTDRNTAYNYWVPVLPNSKNIDGPAYGSSVMNPDAVIINGGYLVRSVSVSGSTLSVSADFNKTTGMEIIGAPKGVTKLEVNGNPLSYTNSSLGNWVAKPTITIPKIDVPELSSLDWHWLDSLPELQPNYDDSMWTLANLKKTYNSRYPLNTPTSLRPVDYKYDIGAAVFRGHFTATGEESSFSLWSAGGAGFASSVWLNKQFIGSFHGTDAANDHNDTWTVPNLKKGKEYAFTIIVDNNGFHENWTPGLEEMKQVRGINGYALASASGKTTNISWKLTGNLGGEDYLDKYRGPLNEDGFFFERQGYHLPGAPKKAFKSGSPYDGMKKAGLWFYAADLRLDLPADQYDIPLAFTFQNSTSAAPYRAQLFVNGFQFGKYAQNVGPQDSFPVPEGILNYNGDNWLGVAVWALDNDGFQIPDFTLDVGTPVLTGRSAPVKFLDAPGYSKRKGAY